MKTTEEWLDENFGHGNWVTADRNTLDAMRLEAFKAGMKFAAHIANEFCVPAAATIDQIENDTTSIPKECYDNATSNEL